MKANEYIKKYGVDCAKEILFHNQDLMNIGFFIDLKRLVESHELIEKYKRGRGIRFRVRWGMYRHGDTQEFNDRLKQAIADVESCMEVQG